MATGSQSSNSALDSLANSLFASVVPTAALFSKVITHVVNFYLDKVAQREQIVRLVERRANAQVMPYVFEALRELLYIITQRLVLTGNPGVDPPVSSRVQDAQTKAMY